MRDMAHDAVQLVGRHKFVACLDQVRANLSHILLVRGEVPLQVRVEVEHQELMRADEPRDEAARRRDSCGHEWGDATRGWGRGRKLNSLHHQKLQLEALDGLAEFSEKALREALRIMQQLDRWEDGRWLAILVIA